MPSRIRVALLVLALFVIAFGPAPRALYGQAGSAADGSGAGFVLPGDLEVALWAESPMFFNPTNIDVDARGRVWVAEAVNYRDFMKSR